MRSETSGETIEGRTFIDQARRAQIVAAAIDAIAELGYARASLARIAKRAGTSKGVITYHFAGKEDLIEAVVGDLFTQVKAYMTPKIAAQPDGAGMLRTYVESNLAYMRNHRNHLLTVLEIALNARDDDGTRLFDDAVLDIGVRDLEGMITHFQATGEFRPDFDPRVMAVTIREVIDSVPRRMARDPDLDLNHYGRQMAALFVRAVQADQEGQA
jgi:TetR/AcrR family transcriptional regulator, fatty acid metabolism regulator protein